MQKENSNGDFLGSNKWYCFNRQDNYFGAWRRNYYSTVVASHSYMFRTLFSKNSDRSIL